MCVTKKASLPKMFRFKSFGSTEPETMTKGSISLVSYSHAAAAAEPHPPCHPMGRYPSQARRRRRRSAPPILHELSVHTTFTLLYFSSNTGRAPQPTANLPTLHPRAPSGSQAASDIPPPTGAGAILASPSAFVLLLFRSSSESSLNRPPLLIFLKKNVIHTQKCHRRISSSSSRNLAAERRCSNLCCFGIPAKISEARSTVQM